MKTAQKEIYPLRWIKPQVAIGYAPQPDADINDLKAQGIGAKGQGVCTQRIVEKRGCQTRKGSSDHLGHDGALKDPVLLPFLFRSQLLRVFTELILSA